MSSRLPYINTPEKHCEQRQRNSVSNSDSKYKADWLLIILAFRNIPNGGIGKQFPGQSIYNSGWCRARLYSSWVTIITPTTWSWRSTIANPRVKVLDPLSHHTSPGGAIIDIGNTATHYDQKAVALETFARPLWGLAPLLLGGGKYIGVERWIKGLASGTDPNSFEYWGASADKDQRMVEMSPLSFAVAIAPEVFYAVGIAETSLERCLGTYAPLQGTYGCRQRKYLPFFTELYRKADARQWVDSHLVGWRSSISPKPTGYGFVFSPILPCALWGLLSTTRSRWKRTLKGWKNFS